MKQNGIILSILIQKNIEVKDAEEIKTKEEFLKNLDNLEKQKGMMPPEARGTIPPQQFNILDLNKDGVVDQNGNRKCY